MPSQTFFWRICRFLHVSVMHNKSRARGAACFVLQFLGGWLYVKYWLIDEPSAATPPKWWGLNPWVRPSFWSPSEGFGSILPISYIWHKSYTIPSSWIVNRGESGPPVLVCLSLYCCSTRGQSCRCPLALSRCNQLFCTEAVWVIFTRFFFQSRVEVAHPDELLKTFRVELALLDKCFSKIRVEPAQPVFFWKIRDEPAQPVFFNHPLLSFFPPSGSAGSTRISSSELSHKCLWRFFAIDNDMFYNLFSHLILSAHCNTQQHTATHSNTLQHRC
jgi:hypothetical protein